MVFGATEASADCSGAVDLLFVWRSQRCVVTLGDCWSANKQHRRGGFYFSAVWQNINFCTKPICKGHEGLI